MTHAEARGHPAGDRSHEAIRAPVAGVGVEPVAAPRRGPFEQLHVVAFEAVESREQHPRLLAVGGLGDN